MHDLLRRAILLNKVYFLCANLVNICFPPQKNQAENIYLLMAIADKEAMRKAAGDALNEDGGNVMAKCSKEVTEEAAGDEDGDKK